MSIALAATDRTDTAADLLATATAALRAAGVGTARLDAEVLLAAAYGVDRAALYLRLQAPLAEQARAAFDALLQRRLAREPLQYIVGRQEFWSLEFVVTPDVLIPRPETELLVEMAVDLCRSDRGSSGSAAPSLCDLGTGSGCIAVALASELPGAAITAADISTAALAVARTNAQRHGVAARISFVESNLFASLGGRQFDVIVCNPPYVATAALAELAPELAWEPRTALEGGADGYAMIVRILRVAPEHLRAGGWVLMEIGAEQGAVAAELARAAGFTEVTIRYDYAGLPRVLRARR